MNKTKAAYERDKTMYAFVGECGGPEIRSEELDELQQEYEDYKSGLFEIDCMIQHFQTLGNEEEVSFWRRLAMHNKNSLVSDSFDNDEWNKKLKN